jgi:hypothetical protein
MQNIRIEENIEAIALPALLLQIGGVFVRYCIEVLDETFNERFRIFVVLKVIFYS